MPDHNFRIVWSPEAEEDLLTIWRSGAVHFSPEIADNHLRDIQNRVENLRVTPFMGRSRDDLLPQSRVLVVYPTVIFYRVRVANIEVVRVVDGRRNLAAIFSKEDE
jgi:toxin ParE1/3/4